MFFKKLYFNKNSKWYIRIKRQNAEYVNQYKIFKPIKLLDLIFSFFDILIKSY